MDGDGPPAGDGSRLARWPCSRRARRRPSGSYSDAQTPKTKTDLDKMGSALQRLAEEDPTLRVYREHDTGETIMSGMGDSHVDVAVKRLKQKFGVELLTGVPKISYKETITKTTKVQGRHKKQTGGRGQFGDTWIRFEPLSRNAGFEFAEEVFGGSVPNSFIPAVEKGMREIILKGVLAGYPTTDFRAVLYDGSYHPVDSSEIAFKLAAHKAFKTGIPQAGPVLIEPVMNVTITIPEQYMGDVMGDMNTKRGRVLGMDQKGESRKLSSGNGEKLINMAAEVGICADEWRRHHKRCGK